MDPVAVDASHVWKRFHRGQFHDSLRDLIPAVAKRLLGQGPKRSELGKDDFWALRDVSFQVHRGEAFGVIGPNGAGKSTLLKILSRILRVNRGAVQINGSLTGLLELGSGFHFDLTGRENIYINGSVLGLRKREIDRKLNAIIEFSGIEAFIDTPVKRLSTGMVQRLAFSVAAHMEPDILLVDEVLSVGDAAFREKCIQRMESLIRSETSVIFVSHNLDQVRRLCSRCLVLNQGTVRFVGDTDRACDAYFACADDPSGGSGATRDSEDHEDACRLLSVMVFDRHGNRTVAVEQFEPLAIEVRYELLRDVPDLHLEILFHTPEHGEISACDNVVDQVPLRGTAGVHTVRVDIDDLPYNDGDYQLKTWISHGAHPGRRSTQPLQVRGRYENHRMVTLLRHRWSTVGCDNATADSSALPVSAAGVDS